jgi:hypothetical protein
MLGKNTHKQKKRDTYMYLASNFIFLLQQDLPKGFPHLKPNSVNVGWVEGH